MGFEAHSGAILWRNSVGWGSSGAATMSTGAVPTRFLSARAATTWTGAAPTGFLSASHKTDHPPETRSASASASLSQSRPRSGPVVGLALLVQHLHGLLEAVPVPGVPPPGQRAQAVPHRTLGGLPGLRGHRQCATGDVRAAIWEHDRAARLAPDQGLALGLLGLPARPAWS